MCFLAAPVTQWIDQATPQLHHNFTTTSRQFHHQEPTTYLQNPRWPHMAALTEYVHGAVPNVGFTRNPQMDGQPPGWREAVASAGRRAGGTERGGREAPSYDVMPDTP